MKKEVISWKKGLLLFIITISFLYLLLFSTIEMFKNKVTGLAVGDQNPGQQTCVELWNCTRWEPKECIENEVQTRTCYNINKCSRTLKKPGESRSCMYMPLPNETNIIIEKTIITYEEIKVSKINKVNRILLILVIIALILLVGFVAYTIFKQLRYKRMKQITINNMQLTKLKYEIKRKLQLGFSREQIRNRLLSQGWNRHIIEKAFSQPDLMKNKNNPY